MASNKTEEWKNYSHFCSMVKRMDIMREKNELCDVILIAEGKEFAAHRLVLAAASAYFGAMFTGDVNEAKQKTITLEDLDYRSLEQVLNFVYTSTAIVNEDNVQNLFVTATMLQIDSLVELCSDFLETQLHESNCLGIKKFADTHGCLRLSKAAWNFAQEHFQNVCKTEEFLQLTTDELIQIISKDTLNVKKEENVYNAVMIWVEYNTKERVEYLAKILEHVRLPLVTWEFLKENVGKNELLKTRKECSVFLTEARQFQSRMFHPDFQVMGFEPVVLRSQPRQSFGFKEKIYIIGGETSPNRQTLMNIEVYNPLTNKWSEEEPMEIGLRAPGAAIVNRCLYVFGGNDGQYAVKTCFELNLKLKRWREMKPMSENRSSVSVINVEDIIYACGGYNDTMSLKTVEKFDPSENVWKRVEDMNEARSMAGNAVMDGLIYIVGGYDGISDLNSAERYDPKTKSWTSIAQMHILRCMPDIGALKSKLYAVGGMDNNVSVTSCEVYDKITNQWTLIGSLTYPRSGLGVASIGNHLYAIGGFDDKDYLSSVEKYDPESDTWSVVSSLTTKRWRFACTT